MNGERVSARKEVREEARVLARLGFEWDGPDSFGHPTFTHPAHGTVTLPETPRGAGRWRERKRREVARLMGVTVAELEAMIAGQATVGKSHRRPRRDRRRRAPRGLRHLSVAPEVAAAPDTPAVEIRPVRFDPADPITERRRDQWARAAAERDRANAEHRFPWRRAA